MLQERLRHFARLVYDGLMQTLRRSPIEFGLIVYACIGFMIVYGSEKNYLQLETLGLAPIFAMVALSVNTLTLHKTWKKLYWICWIPIIPLSIWSGLTEWVDSEAYRITLCILAPLTMLISRKATDNHRFVSDIVIYARSAMVALFFSNVILGLFCAILYSTAYIFGIYGLWVSQTATYALIFTETLLVPTLFLMLIGRWLGSEIRDTRFVDVLLNYIVTPAVLIYLSILYLYIAKIIALWSLPQGGVAYMVFGFTAFALIVKALQEILTHRIYNWFFDHLSLFALPAAVLFWIGVSRRIGEYGWTEPRVWLVTCGIVMSICLLQFFTQRTGRYLYLCVAAFVCFGSLAFVPALHPAQLATRSQATRNQDVVTDKQNSIALYAMEGRKISTTGYTTLYTDIPNIQDTTAIGYNMQNDTLRICFGAAHPPFVISGKELLETQLRKIGANMQTIPTHEVLEANADKLLTYTNEEVKIIFSSIEFDVKDTAATHYELNVNTVLTR
ncbi:MAG: DUF4153 domain-containing protein [Alistipes sp.]